MNLAIRFLAVCLSFFSLQVVSAAVTDTTTPLRAGMAETDITPPVGYRMAGYFDERLATGTHDPLKAKALVLQHDKQKFAFAFCDLVGLSLNVSTNVRAQVSRQLNIPVANIFIASTHSHTGPSFDDVRRNYFHEKAIAKFGKDPQEEIYYPDFLVKKLVEVLTAANSKLSPATVSVAVAKQEGLSFNRRYHMKNGRVAFNPGQLNPNVVGPAGPIDPDVGILLVRPATKTEPMGGLTIFACHCDTIGGTEFSADYPYFLEQRLRGQFGDGYISAFAAGTCGDINHINTGVKEETVKGFDVANRIGKTLGTTVIDAHFRATPILQPRFAVESKTLTIPLQDVTPEQVKAAHEKMPSLEAQTAPFMEKVEAVKVVELANRGKTWPMEVQVFRLDDDTALVGLPGEIFADLGLAIKRASPFKRTLVLSICNDRPSYVPTQKAFAEGSYEVTNARVKPGAGEMLVEAAIRLLKDLKR